MDTVLLRALLLACLLGMDLLAALYLRRRRLSLAAYTLWGLFVLAVPLVGPFVTIAARPGAPRRAA